MKKILFAALAAIVLSACSGEREYLKVKGLSIGLPAKVFVDSMLARGFLVDTTHSSENMTIMYHPERVAYTVTMASNDNKIVAVEEDYRATYNDSTRNLWQTVRDSLEKTLEAWPNAPLLKNDHKLAEFRYNGGKISVLLENTYTPTMSVLYEATVPED